MCIRYQKIISLTTDFRAFFILGIFMTMRPATISAELHSQFLILAMR